VKLSDQKSSFSLHSRTLWSCWIGSVFSSAPYTVCYGDLGLAILNGSRSAEWPCAMVRREMRSAESKLNHGLHRSSEGVTMQNQVSCSSSPSTKHQSFSNLNLVRCSALDTTLLSEYLERENMQLTIGWSRFSHRKSEKLPRS
jgi:hypothetical protein